MIMIPNEITKVFLEPLAFKLLFLEISTHSNWIENYTD